MEEVVRVGQVNQGTTKNQAELRNVLNALVFIVNNGWKYWGDYVKLKGNSNLVMNFPAREWYPAD